MARFEIERLGQKKLIVSRPPKPSVARMLENIYHILGNQIDMLKNRAIIDELDGKDATKLFKYAQTLQLLTAEEDKHTQSYALSEYTDAELAKLTESIPPSE